MEKLLKPKDVCQLVGIELATLYSWTSNDLIPYFKINGLLRFKTSEIERWLKLKRRGISMNERVESIFEEILETT